MSNPTSFDARAFCDPASAGQSVSGATGHRLTVPTRMIEFDRLVPRRRRRDLWEYIDVSARAITVVADSPGAAMAAPMDASMGVLHIWEKSCPSNW